MVYIDLAAERFIFVIIKIADSGSVSFTSCYRESGFSFYVNDLDFRAFVIVG